MPRRRCDQCNQPLPRPLAGPGRRQQYCSHACRQKAYRQLTREHGWTRLVVDALIVVREHWRQGSGTALLQAAESWGRDMGAEIVRLDTYAQSPVSVPFYEQRMGYLRRSIVFQKRPMTRSSAQHDRGGSLCCSRNGRVRPVSGCRSAFGLSFRFSGALRVQVSPSLAAERAICRSRVLPVRGLS
jgi:hypothetical protein